MTTIVHVLAAGAALCGRPGAPSSWPAEHGWVGLDSPDEATCPACRAYYLGTYKKPVHLRENGKILCGPEGSAGVFAVLVDELAKVTCQTCKTLSVHLPAAPPLPLATRAQIDAAESKAAHASIEVFIAVLHEELGKLGCETIMGPLGGSKHIHYSLVVGKAKGVIRYTIVFDSSDVAMQTVLTAEHTRNVGSS